MPFVAPVAIDPTHLDVQPGTFYNFNQFVAGPYLRAGVLWTVLNSHDATPVLTVFKSLDNGLTWNPVDYAHSPTANSYESSYDGINTINVVVSDGSGNMNVIPFSMATGTWGAISAAETSGYFAYCIFSRSDGSCVVIAQGPNPPLPATPGDVAAFFFAGGAWSAPLSLITNFLFTGPVTPATPQSPAVIGIFGTIDATNRVHVFFTYLDNGGGGGAGFAEHMCYQAVSSVNTLGSFTELGAPVNGGQTPNFAGGFTSGESTPCVCPGGIVFPVFYIVGGGVQAVVYVGTPLGAPVWTRYSTGVVVTSSDFTATSIPSASFDGTTLRVVFIPDAAQQTIELSQTTDFATFVFTNSVAFNVATSPVPAGFRFAGQLLVNNTTNLGLGIEFTALAPDQATQQRFFMPLSSPVAPVVSLPFPTVGAGRKRTCPPGKLTALDLGALRDELETLRPPMVEEVRVQPCAPRMRRW